MLTNLKTLKLTYNLAQVDPCIGKLYQLEDLTLGRKGALIEELPASIGDLVKLKRLTLMDNLKSLPVSH